jgi:hypothetical protein
MKHVSLSCGRPNPDSSVVLSTAKIAAEAWSSPGWKQAVLEYHYTRGNHTLIVETSPKHLAHLRRLMGDDVSLNAAWHELNDPRRASLLRKFTTTASCSIETRFEIYRGTHKSGQILNDLRVAIFWRLGVHAHGRCAGCCGNCRQRHVARRTTCQQRPQPDAVLDLGVRRDQSLSAGF